MFHIAICDDSEYDLQEISSALQGLRHLGICFDETWCQSGRALIDDIAEGEKSYHLLILDMLMDSINGIETAKAIRTYDVSMPILIVTSTVQYALAGYQVNAWRYLTKPVDPGELVREAAAVLKSQEKSDETCYVVQSNGSVIRRVPLADILYFESSLHTITLHTMREDIEFRGAIRDVEEQLTPLGFFRIHKSFVVNLSHVRRLSSRSLVMVNGDELDISRARIQQLRHALMDEAEREHISSHRMRS